MKHYTVVSKRKNPDKYIEILKRQNQEAWGNAHRNHVDFLDTHEALLKEQGRYFFDYEKGTTKTAIFNDGTHTKVNIGSTVKFISKVIKMERNEQGKVVITFELGEARI